MQTITELIDNPTLQSLVNMPVFGAILLALVVYRVVSPLIDFLNPVLILTDLGWRLRRALAGAVRGAVTKLRSNRPERPRAAYKATAQ